MSRKNLWLVITTVTIITAGLIFGYSQKISNDAASAQTIKIGYRAHDGYAPLFVGIEKGIFKKYGIDVETFRFDSTNQIVEAMLAGKIDASLGGVNIPIVMKTEEKSHGAMKIFTSYEETAENPTACFIVRYDSPIESVSDLKGKKISLPSGSTPLIVYKAMLKTNKVNFADTEVTSMSTDLQLSALESGQMDAAMVLEPLATIGTYKKISRVLESALWSKFVFNNFPLGTSVVNGKFAQEHRDLTNKLVSATEESIDFINNPANREEITNILTKYTPLEIEITKQLKPIPFKKLDQIDKQKLQQTRDFLLQEGELKTSIDVDNLLYQKL